MLVFLKNINHIIKNLLLCGLFIIATLSSCVGGSSNVNQTAQSDNVLQTIRVQNKSEDSLFKTTDLNKLNFGDSESVTKCLNDVLCVTLDKVPYATYIHGLNESYYWQQPEYLTTLTVNFKKSIRTFKIYDIYNELPDSVVAGHLSQIDFSECENLLKSGVNKGASCQIRITYSGDIMKSIDNLVKIHFLVDLTEFMFSFKISNMGNIRNQVHIIINES